MAGCQTAVSNIVMSCVVFLTLEFITPLFKYTPNAILASIIISAVIGLIDYDAALLIWKIDKFDFVACMGAFFGVVFASVEIGLLIAVSDQDICFFEVLLSTTCYRPNFLDVVFTYCYGRSPYPSPRSSYKLQGHGLQFLGGSQGHLFTGTSNNIQRQLKFQAC